MIKSHAGFFYIVNTSKYSFNPGRFSAGSFMHAPISISLPIFAGSVLVTTEAYKLSPGNHK